jgi:hypothetical protein
MGATEPEPKEAPPHVHNWTTDNVVNETTYQSCACGDTRTVGFRI